MIGWWARRDSNSLRFPCNGFTVRRRTHQLGRLPIPASTRNLVGQGGMRASTVVCYGFTIRWAHLHAQPTRLNFFLFNLSLSPGRRLDAPDTVFGSAACSGVGRASAVPVPDRPGSHPVEAKDVKDRSAKLAELQWRPPLKCLMDKEKGLPRHRSARALSEALNLVRC